MGRPEFCSDHKQGSRLQLLSVCAGQVSIENKIRKGGMLVGMKKIPKVGEVVP